MTAMEWIDLAWKVGSLLVAVAAAVVGWFLKAQADAIAELKRDAAAFRDSVVDLRVALPSSYLKKDEFTEMSNNIFKALRRLEDKLDRMKFKVPPGWEDTTK